MDKYFKSMRIDTNIFLNFRIWLKKKKEISVHVMHKKKCFIIMAVYKVMCTSLDARSDGFFLFGIEQSYPEIKCLKNVDKLEKCACGQLSLQEYSYCFVYTCTCTAVTLFPPI